MPHDAEDVEEDKDLQIKYNIHKRQRGVALRRRRRRRRRRSQRPYFIAHSSVQHYTTKFHECLVGNPNTAQQFA